MRTITSFLALALVGVLGLPAGGAARAEPASEADRAFFEKHVRPLLVERCFSCHSSQAKKLRGGLRLDSRERILKGGDTGPAVIPGHPEQSLLMEAVRYGNGGLQMPPTGKLPDSAVATLEEWIRRGAVFPGTSDMAKKAEGINFAEGRKHWAFQPPRLSPIPATRTPGWIQKPIDAFILAKLEKHKLMPSPPASKRVLIRRATFDLIGLPPTPEEVEAFVADARPDAFARLIERLLASPQYGERWARFWLDIARYCDIAEQWAETKAPAYRYRDWVVRALNEDLPYDQFVQRQLAADLMPEAGAEDLAALGFLGLSPTYWKELKLDKDVIKTVVAEEWEERIQAVCSGFLGLTVACARCHDHKFDPISAQDYYALAGVFASTRQVDRALLPSARANPIQQAHEKVRGLQEQIDKLSAKKPIAAEHQKKIGELKTQIDKIRKTTPEFDAPLAQAVEECSLFVLPDGPYRTKLEYRSGVAQNVALQIRGNPVNAGPIVPRRFLAVLSSNEPKPFAAGSGRRELARAIVAEGAPLTARVLVNRVWKQHFGQGLVDTPSDFGTQGSRPTHPELLDDLTARFITHGWSLKWLHREIMLSATYQQSAERGAPSATASASRCALRAPLAQDNRLLWHMNRRRLEIEAWRDAMLAVSGSLRLEVGGAPRDLGDPANLRRTLYGIVKRRELNDLLRLHDFPDPTGHSAGRIPTTTPLQQLFVLNSPFLQQQAAALAKRMQTEAPGSLEARIEGAYRLLFGRSATPAQVRLAVDFLTQGQLDRPIPNSLWEQYAQALLGSNEFLFID